jgi:hypothetical protein
MEYDIFPSQYREEKEIELRNEINQLKNEQNNIKQKLGDEKPSLIKRIKRKFGFYYLAILPLLFTIAASTLEIDDEIFLIFSVLTIVLYYCFPSVFMKLINHHLSKKYNDKADEIIESKSLYKKLLNKDSLKKYWAIFVFLFGVFSEGLFDLHDDDGIIFNIIWIACILLGIVFSKIRKKSLKLQISYESKTTELEQKTKLLQNMMNDSTVYEKGFEEKVKQMSVQLMDSAVVDRIVDWLSEKYFKPIETADRKPHIESIKIPFVIQVFKNKIVSPSGVFDFVEECCQLLNSPLEQCAVCHAIAAKLDLQTHTRITEDPSGTPYTVEQEYSNDNEAAIVTITYSAVNGHYKEAESFF